MEWGLFLSFSFSSWRLLNSTLCPSNTTSIKWFLLPSTPTPPCPSSTWHIQGMTPGPKDRLYLLLAKGRQRLQPNKKGHGGQKGRVQPKRWQKSLCKQKSFVQAGRQLVLEPASSTCPSTVTSRMQSVNEGNLHYAPYWVDEYYQEWLKMCKQNGLVWMLHMGYKWGFRTLWG